MSIRDGEVRKRFLENGKVWEGAEDFRLHGELVRVARVQLEQMKWLNQRGQPQQEWTKHYPLTAVLSEREVIDGSRKARVKKVGTGVTITTVSRLGQDELVINLLTTVTDNVEDEAQTKPAPYLWVGVKLLAGGVRIDADCNANDEDKVSLGLVVWEPQDGGTGDSIISGRVFQLGESPPGPDEYPLQHPNYLRAIDGEYVSYTDNKLYLRANKLGYDPLNPEDTDWDEVVVLDPDEGTGTSKPTDDRGLWTLPGESRPGARGKVVPGAYAIKVVALAEDCYRYTPVQVLLEVRTLKAPDTKIERYEFTISQHTLLERGFLPYGWYRDRTTDGLKCFPTSAIDGLTGPNPHRRHWWEQTVYADLKTGAIRSRTELPRGFEPDGSWVHPGILCSPSPVNTRGVLMTGGTTISHSRDGTCRSNERCPGIFGWDGSECRNIYWIAGEPNQSGMSGAEIAQEATRWFNAAFGTSVPTSWVSSADTYHAVWPTSGGSVTVTAGNFSHHSGLPGGETQDTGYDGMPTFESEWACAPDYEPQGDEQFQNAKGYVWTSWMANDRFYYDMETGSGGTIHPDDVGAKRNEFFAQGKPIYVFGSAQSIFLGEMGDTTPIGLMQPMFGGDCNPVLDDYGNIRWTEITFYVKNPDGASPPGQECAGYDASNFAE